MTKSPHVFVALSLGLAGCQTLATNALNPQASPSPTPSATATPSVAATPAPGATEAPEVRFWETTGSATASFLVMHGLGQTVERVDPATGKLTRLFETGKWPNQLVRIGSSLMTVESNEAKLAVGPFSAPAIERRISLELGSNPMEVIEAGSDEVLVSSVMVKKAFLVRLSDGTTLKTLDLPGGHQTQGAMARLDNRIYMAAADTSYESTPPYAATTTWSGIQVYDIDQKAFVAPISLETTVTPWAIATLPSKRLAVGTVSGGLIVDPKEAMVTATLDAGARFASIAVDGDGKGWAGLGASVDGKSLGSGLVRFDPTSGQILTDSRKDWSASPGDTSASRLVVKGKYAWVPNFGEDKVTIMDLASASVVSRTDVGDGPQALVLED